jgi:hypothetical protein
VWRDKLTHVSFQHPIYDFLRPSISFLLSPFDFLFFPLLANGLPNSKVNSVSSSMTGKLLGRFAQSHNNALIEITPSHAIYLGNAYPLTWIEDHTFYFLFADGYWYYIRNGNTYEVIKYETGHHKLLPI